MSEPTPFLDRFREHADRGPDQVAYSEVPDGRQVTYGELKSRAESFASDLRNRFDTNSTVLICCPNQAHFPAAFLGALMAGCLAFPVSHQSTVAELHAAADTTRPAAIVRGGLSIDALHCSADGAPQLRGGGMLLQSSGTTGRPKVVHRTLASIDAVADQMCRAIGFTEHDQVLAMLPLCHSYGLEHGLLAPLAAGASVRLCSGFDLAVTLRELVDGRISVLPGVPSMFEMLANLAPRGTHLRHVRTAYSAGGPLPAAVFEAVEQSLGVRMGQLYGATEIGSVTYGDPHATDFDPASVGRPMSNVEVRIVSRENPATSLEERCEGEICVRAQSMFAGYVGDDSSPLSDGFFPTGDLGRLDARGNLTITGRLKLLIDVGGLKVNPMEVEDVLARHPGVAACVVVPVVQSQTLSRLKAVVTPRDPEHPPDADDLRQFARQQLSPHKVPRLIEVRTSLPRSATGKILRNLVEV